jgi:oleate hydratase
MISNSKATLVGGGIGTLAAAAFMIRDGGMEGRNVTILDALPVMGGSLDAGGTAALGYSLRGGRMLTTDNYECTWDLFKTIPSLTATGSSVFEETLAFNERHPSHALARLVDRRAAKVGVPSMGFSMQDRLELLKISSTDEAVLGASRITDWLSPAFFDTEFWFMWATTFAFQPWHSAVEFKRYLHRFMLEFTRIDTLAGVKRTVYNQYESMVLPLQAWLASKGVNFVPDCNVIELVPRSEIDDFEVAAIKCIRNGTPETIAIGEGDLVFLQNASMTDASSLGSMSAAPALKSKADSGGWLLWEHLAASRPEFGKPSAFNGNIAQSCWESFTVTLKDSDFFDTMMDFTGNVAGTGGLVTFKDSNWLMSVVLARQPHFVDQPGDVQVFWGYGLFPDRIGNFVAKPMSACTGDEILTELYGHLRFDRDPLQSVNCIPCRMPYITSMFMPRSAGDRPLPVPPRSRNFAFVSQFVEIPEDVVFTVEYSVRAAQTAVYQLLKIARPVAPITPNDKSLHTRFEALLKAFK